MALLISPNGIRTILFDLDGTLRHNRPTAHQVFFDHAVELGLPDSADGRRQALRWAHAYFASSEQIAADRADFGEDESRFWENYAGRYLLAFGCEPDLARALAPALHRYMAEEYQPEDWIPDDVPATLERLKNSGFQLGVLTNRHEPVDRYLASIGLRDFLDLTLTAGQAEVWKPDVKVFHRALQEADCPPQRAIYVGDNYYADIVGAHQAGMHPVLVDPDGTFPDANCHVIHAIGELPKVIAGMRHS